LRWMKRTRICLLPMNSSSNSYSVSVPWSNQRQLGQMKCSDC